MECNWINSFLGKDKDVVECETLMLSVPRKILEGEVSLFATKWFDYRRLHPVQATYLFAHHYEVAYRRSYAMTRDVVAAEFTKPLRASDLFESADVLSVWRARQACDSIGVPYDFYAHRALEHSVKNGWRFIPRPNQIYTDSMVDDVREAWEVRCGDILQIVNDAELFETHELKDWYIKQLKRRLSPAYAASRLLTLGAMTTEDIRNALGSVVADKANRLCCL